MDRQTINCNSISSTTNLNCHSHLLHSPVKQKSRLPVLTHERSRRKKARHYRRKKIHPYLRVKNGFKCKHQAVCERFIDKVLQLRSSLKFDLCYCYHCHGRNDKTTYERGVPPMKYVLPRGWTRFALRSPSLPGVEKVLRDWHIAYHGTSTENVANILLAGNLKLPGTKLENNHVVTQPQGHYTASCRPDYFDINQIFVSPSPIYAGCEVYAKHKPFTDPFTGRVYKCRVMFQLCIKPRSYAVSEATVACDGRIDDHFENSKIEWSTKDSKNIMLSGLLISAKEISNIRKLNA